MESQTFSPQVSVAREKLLARRAKLETTRAGLPHLEHLSQLMREVDAALERIEAGTYGLCEVCRGPIETERLTADPLVKTCLDDLTEAEQRALEQDLDLAGRIQHGLLPKKQASFDGWETCYHYEPLGPASGDYCDLIASEEGALLFLLGDVAGKGVAASVLMAHLHAIVRTLVSLQLPVQQLMERANRIFYESTGGDHYATLVCGRATAGGDVEICNAGHCPMLWIRPGAATALPATGLPIGLFSRTAYATTAVTMSRDETLLLYTDGITESRDASDAEYGMERLLQAAARHARASAEDLVSECRSDVTSFRAGWPRADDVTILAVRRSR